MSRKKYTNICEICEATYNPFYKTQRFCSNKCSSKNTSIVLSGRKNPRGNRILVNCDTCNIDFYKWKNDITERNFCSRKCSSSHIVSIEARRKTGLLNKGKKIDPNIISKRNFVRGENHHNWKGGVTHFKRKGLYANFKIKYLKCPEDFKEMSRKDGYVMEHRIVMALFLNRVLLRTEVVHHIDHNPENNNISNLMLFSSNSEHKKYENRNPINKKQ
jgi:endogenous inhibitor of DNA gyrase (YacG/DUF329 family)